MYRKDIRDLKSPKDPRPHFCDVIVDGKTVLLETKTAKGKYVTVNLVDLVFQIRQALECAKNL